MSSFTMLKLFKDGPAKSLLPHPYRSPFAPPHLPSLSCRLLVVDVFLSLLMNGAAELHRALSVVPQDPIMRAVWAPARCR
jgi:hypothetical protein